MRVAFFGPDLMMLSRVQAVCRDMDCEFARGDASGADLAFVDLNAGESALAQIDKVRDANADVQIVAFCGHEAKDVRQAAMQAGASLCVTNGALVETVQRLIAEKVGAAS